MPVVSFLKLASIYLVGSTFSTDPKLCLISSCMVRGRDKGFMTWSNLSEVQGKPSLRWSLKISFQKKKLIVQHFSIKMTARLIKIKYIPERCPELELCKHQQWRAFGNLEIIRQLLQPKLEKWFFVVVEHGPFFSSNAIPLIKIIVFG